MTVIEPLEFYLLTLKPITVFSGRVNGTPNDPYVSVTFDAGGTGTSTSIGTSGAPVPGNTVQFGTAAGGRERGAVRLRSWNPGDAGGTFGTIDIAESDDAGPQIADDDFITITLDWRLWPKFPRLVQDGQNVTFYEDYDVSYANQTSQWIPTAVAGPPAVVFLEGGSAQAKFVGDRSQAHAPGATITTYLWTGHGSSEGTSSSQGTIGSPVTFTWTSEGQKLVTLKVTDSNGKTHTAYTWVFVIDPANPDNVAYTEFDPYNDNFDTTGGGEASFTVHGVASVAQFPREALVVHACRGTLETDPTTVWPFRENVLFTGHIAGNSIRQDPDHNTTSFRATSVFQLMNNLKTFPVSLTDTNAPANWTQASNMTVDRLASFLFHWRSTLADMTPVIYSGYTPLIGRQDFGPTTLMQQLRGELLSDAWMLPIVNHQGVLHLEIDYNHMLVAERTAAGSGKTIHKGVWVDSINVVERAEYEVPAGKIKASGIAYGGGGDPTQNITPLFSEAPGDLPKAFGRESGGSRFILNNQTDLNIRCGFMLAKENQRFPRIQTKFINDGSFATAPQIIFPAIIEPNDNNRGLQFNPELIPRRISRSYDHALGLIYYDIEFEPSSTGPPGETISLSKKPPTQNFTPPVPAWEPTDLAIMTWSFENGMQYFGLGGEIWEDRNQGLAGADKQDVFGGIDPWWWTEGKQATFNPDHAIAFKCAGNKIWRSVDAGRIEWLDITPTGTASGTDFISLNSNLFTDSIHYFLARWLSGATYMSRLYKTEDDGTTWESADIS